MKAVSLKRMFHSQRALSLPGWVIYLFIFVCMSIDISNDALPGIVENLSEAVSLLHRAINVFAWSISVCNLEHNSAPNEALFLIIFELRLKLYLWCFLEYFICNVDIKSFSHLSFTHVWCAPRIITQHDLIANKDTRWMHSPGFSAVHFKSTPLFPLGCISQ